MAILTSGTTWIIEKIPIELIGMAIPIFITLVAYTTYKSFVKYKHRKLKLDNFLTRFLKIIMFYSIFIPFFYIEIQAVLYYSNKEELALYVPLTLGLLIGGVLTYDYIKVAKEEQSKQEELKISFKIILQFISIYIMPIALFTLAIFLTMVFSGITFEIIRTGLSNQEKFVELVSMCILIYIINICITFFMYIIFKEDLTKKLKEVRIFYKENEKIKVALDIRYKDFDINKHFISFYSHKKGYTQIIKTEDLVRFEYHY